MSRDKPSVFLVEPRGHRPTASGRPGALLRNHGSGDRLSGRPVARRAGQAACAAQGQHGTVCWPRCRSHSWWRPAAQARPMCWPFVRGCCMRASDNTSPGGPVVPEGAPPGARCHPRAQIGCAENHRGVYWGASKLRNSSITAGRRGRERLSCSASQGYRPPMHRYLITR